MASNGPRVPQRRAAGSEPAPRGGRLGPRFRLLLWAPGVAAALVATVLAAVLLPSLLHRSTEESLSAALQLLAPLVVEQTARPVAALQDEVVAIARGAGLRLTVIREDGTVVADSARDLAGVAAMDDHSDRPEVIAALATGTGTVVRRSATTGEVYVNSARALRAPGGELWVVRLGRPLSELDDLDSRLGQVLAMALLGGALAALVVGLWFRRRVLEPFAALVGASRHLAEGDAGRRVPVPEGEELGTLARSLNLLAERVEEQIAAKEGERRQLDEILAGMSEGVLLTGPTGAPVFANAAFRRLFGLEPATRIGELLERVREPLVHRRLAAALVGQPAAAVKVARETITLEVTALPLRALGGALLIVRDVTDAERLTSMRRDFVANLSHELKNPLAVIRGAAETVQVAGATDQRVLDRFTERVVEQCYRLEDLLKDLLTLSRLESPEAAAQRRPVDLAAVARRAVGLVAPLAERHAVRLEADLAPVPELEGDGPALERLVLNLLDNGIKYNRRGGLLALRLAHRDGAVTLEVEDQGAGIPTDELPRIFERFYRVDKGRGRGEGGSGLGLAIVKHVAQAHGGGVEVASRLGEGTLFRVTLPMGQAAATGE